MTDRYALKDYLSKNGCLTTEHVMSTLEPLFLIRADQHFPLVAKKEVDTKELKLAIGMVSRKKVKKISFVSRENLFSKPEWMTEHTYRSTPGASVRTWSWASAGVGLMFALGQDYWMGLRASLRNSFKDSFRYSLRYSQAGIFFFTGFSLVNNYERASRIEPLINFMSKCHILGEKNNGFGTWLVMVK